MTSNKRKFEIDLEKEWDLVCQCCGVRCKSYLGFVHEGQATRAAYYVRWVYDNPAHDVLIALGIGGWGGNTIESDRVFVGLKGLKPTGRDQKFELIDPDDTPWSENHMLGRKVTVETAKGTVVEKEANLLANFILNNDSRLLNQVRSN